MMKNFSNLTKFIKNEMKGWSKFDLIFLSISLFCVLFSSIYLKDSIIAIISAVCGLLYTVIAGKGKISCYVFGIIGTSACAYLSYKIGLFGAFAIHAFYYLPMEVLGIFFWKNHLNKENQEIIKEKLTKKELVLFLLFTVLLTFVSFWVFNKIGDPLPLMDAFISVLSIVGMILTVKRCIEQWLVWTMVNFLSILMWLQVFLQGERTFSIFLVRVIYFFLGVYFFIKWKQSKEFER